MQIVKLNLIPGGVLPVCFASQNDTGRVIRFMLFEGENVFTLSGAESIELRLKKPDGSELVESVTNTGADYVDVVTTADTCDTAGASVGEIAITDGGDVLGSANFGLFVESDAFDGGDIITQTATGAIATFETNIETAFASLTAEINPVQSGTGTPSPQNVRPISGFSALNVTLADGDMQTVDTATVNFGQTVYGGVADVTGGNTTSKYEQIKISDMTWTASGDFFYSSLPLKKVGNTTFLCECLRVVDVAGVSQMTNGDIKGHPSNTNMYIKNTDWASATDLYNAIGDYYIVYELATPIEITTTPENLTAIVGQNNNVYGDTNGDTEVEYYIEV